MAVPHFDQGVALNMVITLQPEAAAFDPETFPEWFWVSSLFGRVTHNLVLREEIEGGLRDRRARAQGGRRHPALALAAGFAQDTHASSWRHTTARRSGPAATITTFSRCRTDGGES